MLEDVKIVDLEFVIRPILELDLPLLPASTLRGGIGYTLKRIVCHESLDYPCHQCKWLKCCVYPRLFEQMEEIRGEHIYFGYVRPFVISTPIHRREIITADQRFTFGVRIFGEAVSYVPYIIASVLELSEKGIGQRKQKFVVESVTSRNEIGMVKRIFSFDTGTLSEPWVISGKRVIDMLAAYKDCREIELRFETPCQIQIKGQLQQDLPFTLFIQNLLRRIEAMLAHHQNIYISREKVNELIEMSKNVVMTKSELQLFRNQRFSTRQQKSIRLDGFIGTTRYKGDLEPFLEWIYAGMYFHLGKQTVFGLGRYECAFL
ncbi:CRISPR-associated endoribonuclease Cas6 [Anoxybacillus thermarum]|uniref:CRISPR-associated endoribonuclease Cas6 n=1 Tax=Anoxybacillus thermarum TaxID=404937 RepID=A0A0D0RYW0_9BACL|nr:CRISPR system precrRNA processing endoribonuclease RAMP protein Cas6 [Anoxybacillus thermarum]KIQ94505.1 CRISPR-associated endoribonuclease Cas6 [Anoxybacillus thermarum]